MPSQPPIEFTQASEATRRANNDHHALAGISSVVAIDRRSLFRRFNLANLDSMALLSEAANDARQSVAF